jgi:CRP/FNR family cyclic AMP-dependent transcriptional regulator
MADLLEFGITAFDELLPRHLRQELGKAAVTRLYKDGELIQRRGDRKPGLSIIRSGAVKLCNFGADGSAVTTVVLGKGQIFGEFTLLTDLPRTHDAIAVGRTAVDQVSRSGFEDLAAREPDLLRILAGSTALRLHAMLELLDDFRRLPLPVLTAKILLSMSLRSGESRVVKCSQADLAVTLGVSRVSIGKVLKRLQADSLIIQRYGRIEIPEVENLKSWIAERDHLFRFEA